MKIEDKSVNFLRKTAYVGGFDFRRRWAKDTYEVTGFFLGSNIIGSEESILRAQMSSARYFQRPDAYFLYRNHAIQSLTKVGNYIAFFPSYLLRFIGKLLSRDLTGGYRGFGSTTKDQGMDEDMVQIGTVGLIQTRK